MYNNPYQESGDPAFHIIQAELHVSPEGKDSNPGTADRPLGSIAKARDLIRGMNSGMQGDIIVCLHGGIYPFRETLIFNAGDSGTNGFNIIYTAYRNERPVISGGVKVSDWEKVENGPHENMWAAAVPEIEYTRHFYVQGKSAARARGMVDKAEAWDVLKNPDMELCRFVESFHSFQGEFPVYEGYRTSFKQMTGWRNQKDIEFVYDVGWSHSVCPVEEIVQEGEEAYVRMRMPCFRDCQIKCGVQIGSPSYIENAFELMDEPGEWYFNRETRVLYYIPRDGEALESAEAFAPVVEQLIRIEGTLDNPVHSIRFQGITFMDTTYLKPGISGHAEVFANLTKDPGDDVLLHSSFIKTPSAIVLDAARGIVFSECTFTRLGSGAIDIQNGSSENTILGCKFEAIAGSGVQIGGFTAGDAHPLDERAIVKNNSVRNSFFHDIGTEYKGSVAILAGYVQGTVIAHNEISQIAYSGISVGMGWGFWDEDPENRIVFKIPDCYPRFNKSTVARNNRIEYNHVHHVMQKLHDGAGIYTLSMQPGSVIRGNLVHDNGDARGQRQEAEVLVANEEKLSEEVERVSRMGGFPGGIYLDEGSGGFEVAENILYNVTVPIFIHVMMKHRIETLHLHDNYFNSYPGDPAFPVELAGKAGLEEPYRSRLMGTV